MPRDWNVQLKEPLKTEWEAMVARGSYSTRADLFLFLQVCKKPLLLNLPGLKPARTLFLAWHIQRAIAHIYQDDGHEEVIAQINREATWKERCFVQLQMRLDQIRFV